MKETFVTQFKWFWAWQDDRQEAWLEEMSQKGLHLRNIKAFGRYVFEVDATRKFTYRMDFNQDLGKNNDYFDLMEEAGWECVVEVLGWQYWRKESSEGKKVEIFTDNDSKIRKYQRIIASLIAPTSSIFIVLASFARFPGRHPQWVVILTLSLYAVWTLFLAVSIFKIAQRIKNLKQMKSL
jgi:hypothetical protein